MQRLLSRRHWSQLWIVLLCLFLALQPALVVAAPVTQIKLPKASKQAPIAYDDPDGLFHIEYPATFHAPEATSFADTLAAPLTGQQAEQAYRIRHDEQGAITIALLHMDRALDNANAWNAFIDELLVAYGGDDLAALERQINTEDAFVAYVEGEPADEHLVLYSQGVGNVAVVFIAAVPLDQWDTARKAITAAFDSFTWYTDTALAFFDTAGAAEGRGPETATASTTAAATSELPELVRFRDPDETFTLYVPAKLEARVDTTKPNAYGYGFYAAQSDANTIALPTLSVSFVLAQQVLAGAVEGPVQPLSDDEWQTLIEKLKSDLGQSGEVTDERRNDAAHTAYLVTEMKFDESSGLRLLTWWEERDGVLANFSLYAPLTADESDPMLPLVSEVLTSFSWSSSKVTALIGRLGEATPPALVDFRDPFGLLGASLPAAYPLFAAYYDGEGMSYQFATTQAEGLIHVTLRPVNDTTLSATDWAAVVKDSAERIVQIVTTQESAGELLTPEVDAPTLENGNSALFRAGSDNLQAALLLQETDGVLAIVIAAAPPDIWAEREEMLLATLTASVEYDPTTVRTFLAERTDIGTAVLNATMTAGRPVDGEEVIGTARFVPTDTVALLTVFPADSAPTGELDLQIYTAPDAATPVAQYNVDLGRGERVETNDFIIKPGAENTKVALLYHSDVALVDSPHYRARLSYNGYLIAVYGFAVTTGVPAFALPAVQLVVNDGDAATPVTPILGVFYTGDTVWIRGTIDAPADSQLRLFWLDDQGNVYLDTVSTITLAVANHAYVDWFQFALGTDWTSGVYHARITLNGETLWSGDYTVLPAEERVALDKNGEAFYRQLALPSNQQLVTAVEGIDYAFTAQELITNVFDLVGAWLRGQGWQRALPLLDTPTEARLQRWVKGGYQFIIQLGGDQYDQFWLQYRIIAKEGFTPLPSGQPLSADLLYLGAEMAKVSLTDEKITAAALSPNNRWLAVTTDAGLFGIYSFPALELVQWWRIADGAYAHPVFSQDSQHLALAVNGAQRLQIHHFRYADVAWLAESVMSGHTAPITSLRFIKEDTSLVSTSEDGALLLWALDGATLPLRSTLGTPVTDFGMAPDGASMVLGLAGGVVGVYNAVDQSEIASFTPYINRPHVYLRPQNDATTSGEVVVVGDNKAEVWHYADGAGELSLTYEPSDALYTIVDAALSPDGSLFVTTGHYVIFFDAASGERLVTWGPTDATGEGVTVQAVGFSPDGQFLWVIDEQGVLRLRGLAEGNG